MMATTQIGSQETPEQLDQHWIQQLEQWTHIFYNQADPKNPQWQAAQSKLLQFQKIHDPLNLCMSIIKQSKNQLVLYQATLCLKNAVIQDLKKFDINELYKLFQFLYEFLCAQAIENEMSVNETAALICAMVLKRISSERNCGRESLSELIILMVCDKITGNPEGNPQPKESDMIAPIINTLCNNVKNPNENLSKKLASALILTSLMVECQLSHRPTLLGIRIWQHVSARKLIEAHLVSIMQACLEAINWAFSSNLLNPLNMTAEMRAMFNLIGCLINCVENTLSFDSNATFASGCERVFKHIQTSRSRRDHSLSHSSDLDRCDKYHRAWSSFIMTPSVVQFMFDLYSTIKSMVNVVPNWSWPTNLLKNCLNCLYYLSEIHNTLDPDKTSQFPEFVGQLMVGAVKIMSVEITGIDDSFQIACLMTSISLRANDIRDTINKINPEHLIPFLECAQRFTCKVFTLVASTASNEEEDEEEKTVDALLDFWHHFFRNYDMENPNRSISEHTPQTLTLDTLKAHVRVIVESYISCHLHKPLGQLVPKEFNESKVLDLDNADDEEDGNLHDQQLSSFGTIARLDAEHTANLLLELLTTRVEQLETLLAQAICTTTPESCKDWEYLNDDLHWLFLMLQHFLTQTGYGEIGFMCTAILNLSVKYKADPQKTIQCFEACDYKSKDVDPVVRLVLVTIKMCRIECVLCQNGNTNWLSAQTNSTVTTLLSRFCLSYLAPREDFCVISEAMNYCFGQDSPTMEKFLRFVVERTCCVVIANKTDPHIVRKNVHLLNQLLTFFTNICKVLFIDATDGATKIFKEELKPEKTAAFPPRVAKSVIKLATKLYDSEDDLSKLVDFFNGEWSCIVSAIQTRQHQSEIVLTKFMQFCEFANGVCEACDEEISDTLFDRLLSPIVEAMPDIIKAFKNFYDVPVAVFELLCNIVRLPSFSNILYESTGANTYYTKCKSVIQAYWEVATTRTDRGDEEEDCADIHAVLKFSHELMKHDWANTCVDCDVVIKFAMEKIGTLIKPEYLQFPNIRSLYYRLLLYLVDESERIASLNDTLLNTITSSILLALQSQFDRDVDNNIYTIITIVCRAMYYDKDMHLMKRLEPFMKPILPAVFQSAISQGSYTINTESAELMAPAVLGLRCCFPDVYRQLFTDLINRQDDAYTRSKVEGLFLAFESKTSQLTFTRTACRDFNQLFVPFLSELHNYVADR